MLTLTNEFEQYSISVNTEFEIARVTVEFGFNNKKGDFAVNNAQLEKGNGTAEYNYVENGNFTNGTDKWSTATIVNESINGESVKAVKLTGGLPQYTVGDGLDRTANSPHVSTNGYK